MRWDPLDGWGEAELVDALDGETDAWEALDVAADEAGGAIVVWSQHDGDALGIWSSRYRAGEGWTDPLRLDPDEGRWADQPRVDVAPDGTAAVVWHARYSEVWAAILPP